MDNVAFKFDSYKFPKASINFETNLSSELSIQFSPKGIFYPRDSKYELSFDVTINSEDTHEEVVAISATAYFSFLNTSSISDIPDYFYPNSLAIVFPYIRAFISTLSLQANIRPIILPTINLIGITKDLKERTEVAE